MLRTITIISFLLINFQLFGQENVEFRRRNFEDIDALKKAEDHIDKGDEFREKANEKVRRMKDPGDLFHKALSHYLEAQEFNPDNAELNYKIGNCYLYTNEKYKAPKHILKAQKLDPDQDDFFFFYLGWVYQLNKEFDKAIEQYEKFKEEASNSDVELMEDELDQRIEGCEEAPKFIENHERVWVDNIKSLNTSADELSPSITTDGTTMLFSSSRKNEHSPNERGEYDMEVYSSSLKDGEWQSPKNIGEPVNTENDEVISNLSYDGQKMLLFQVRNGQADIFESMKDGLDWKDPVNFSKNVNRDESNETYASYNFDDIKLYYLTDRERGTKGGYDVFFSGAMVKERRKYGKGQRAPGNNVSTSLHEGPVYLHPNGKVMYFCSQGHNSMGGYDIFVSRKKYNQWMEPKNLGYPINTPYDDMFFARTANGKFAYIASNRPGGEGGMDLYKVTFWGPEKPVMVDTEDQLIASLAHPLQTTKLEGKVEVEEKQSLTVFKGKTIDALTRKPVKASIEIIDNESGEPIRTIHSNKATGKFLLSLPSGKNYGIAVKADGYLFHSENFNLPENSSYNLVNKKVELKNIEVGSKIALRNVFFETGKAEIKNGSDTELDRLVKLLEDVPSLKIELSGHTDNRGSEKLNKELSQKRAEAVMKYLIDEGIDASRLKAKGYGSSKPVATNKTMEGRQKNRRTEFKIIAN